MLVSTPGAGSEPDQAPFQRLSREDLDKLEAYELPSHSDVRTQRFLKRATFEDKRDEFLAAEGARRMGARKPIATAACCMAKATAIRVGQTPQLPGIELAAEDYRTARAAGENGCGTDARNNERREISRRGHERLQHLADIPGRDAKAGYVMAGAHLDSWIAGGRRAGQWRGQRRRDGGRAHSDEARREAEARHSLCAVVGAKSKRSLGSLAYVEKYLATRPPITDPELAKLFPD